MKSESSGFGAQEKRSAIELLACRQRMEENNSYCRWVSSNRQLADGLTKSDKAWTLAVFQRNPIAAIHYDPNFVAAKKLPKVPKKQQIINARRNHQRKLTKTVSFET